MTWNEPGGKGPGGKGRDPWGGGGDGPPDMDEVLRNFQRKLKGLFGGGSGGSGGDSGSGGAGGFLAMLGGIALLAGLFYVVAGFYQVDDREQAVVLRLGAFKEIKQPGLRWDPPLVTRRFVVNVTGEREFTVDGLMLTEDEAIVELGIVVQYNVVEVRDFVLNVRNPDTSVHQAAESALRHVVGSSELNQVISGGRQAIGEEIKERIQRYLDHYQAGVLVRSVNMLEGRPPREVRSAFDDVIRASEDQDRLRNEALAYANRVVPEARGRAQRMIEEATAYTAEVVARAEGESERFTRLLAEYQLAPEVTRERLYIDAVEGVMRASSKVLVDVEGGNNMLYLPLDRMIERGQRTGDSGRASAPEDVRAITEQVTRDLARPARGTTTVRREVR